MRIYYYTNINNIVEKNSDKIAEKWLVPAGDHPKYFLTSLIVFVFLVHCGAYYCDPFT